MDRGRLVTTALSIGVCAAWSMGLAPIHLPMSAGHLTGATTRATTRPDHSGDGYVTNFVKGADTVAFHVSAVAGVYDVRLRYCSPGGHKVLHLRVNDVTADVMLPQTDDRWTTADAGRVDLGDGDNALAIGGGWGHYDLDAVDLTPATRGPATRPAGVLCDPRATPAARHLMQRLQSGYGSVTLSGGYGGTEEAYVAAHADGRRPALYGSDLMEFSPTRVAHGADPTGIVEDVLRHAGTGQAVTLSWHWNAPAHLLDTVVTGPGGRSIDRRWYKGFNADASTFDLAGALRDPSSDDYRMLLRDIDAVAAPLKRLADAGVPVLWRPLHEADGQWFWWGSKGPVPFVALWRLMHDRLTGVHGLHNLIWVYSYANRVDPRWYPGDGYVDVVGVDGYPTDNRDAMGQAWLDGARLTSSKLMALTEFDGVPDVARMHRLGYPWAYFVSWHDPNGPAKTGAAEVRRRYADGFVTDLSRWEKTR
jgi:mannan endo-1,4-beta-mannosidase